MLGESNWTGEGPVGEGGQMVLYLGVQYAEHGGWLPAYHAVYSLAPNRSGTRRTVAYFVAGRLPTLMAAEYWGSIGLP